MGIFDFVKSVGESISGGVKSALSAASAKPAAGSHASMLGAAKPAAAAPKAAVAPPPAEAIKDHIVNLGLDMKDFEVRVEGDKVILGGAAPSDEIREKVILAAGNTLGVAQVQEEIKVAAAGPASNFYTVKKGDTLSKIAKTEYGNPNKYAAIFEANKPMLTHPDKIYPGQVLRIPPMSAAA
jgi:nucleoid-associated protein YgaU